MKANYNLAKRINPSTKEKLWYAVPASKGVMDIDETARMATADTTLSKGEYKHVMEVTGEKLMPLILSGIIESKLEQVKRAYAEKGLSLVEQIRKGEWFALAMRREK